VAYASTSSMNSFCFASGSIPELVECGSAVLTRVCVQRPGQIGARDMRCANERVGSPVL
jgi:hypothetical protein